MSSKFSRARDPIHTGYFDGRRQSSGLSAPCSSFVRRTSRYPNDSWPIRNATCFQRISIAISCGTFYDRISSLWKCNIKINWCSDTLLAECASEFFSPICPMSPFSQSSLSSNTLLQLKRGCRISSDESVVAARWTIYTWCLRPKLTTDTSPYLSRLWGTCLTSINQVFYQRIRLLHPRATRLISLSNNPVTFLPAFVCFASMILAPI